MGRYIEIKKINVGLLSSVINETNHIKFMEGLSSNFGLSGFESESQEKKDFIYRAMAFDISQSGLTDDLLFTSPNPYKIKNIVSTETPKFKKISIKNYYNLANLLTSMGYKDAISRKELEDLMRSITSDPDWLLEIASLFGFAKNESGFYYPSGESDLPQEGFRVLRDVNDMGSYMPCIFEPNYFNIRKTK